MSKAWKNFQRDGFPITDTQFRKGRKMAAEWAWYNPDEYDDQLKLVEWDDPDYPEGILIECGNLARIHFRAPEAAANSSRHPRRQRDTTIAFPTAVAQKAQLAFDPEHPSDRLYMLIPDRALHSLAQRFWKENPIHPRYLSEWAMLAGGRHAKGGYPHVLAKPVGVMTAVVYFKDKEGDGPSYYIHKMGEVTCYFPILACDERGRLWVCGGNYLCPTGGITD
tara:strand:+ start:263 stop:928 length:666 start_codon:yes stop_codon:yes gene_type:complete